jgi:hypothetical protein
MLVSARQSSALNAVIPTRVQDEVYPLALVSAGCVASSSGIASSWNKASVSLQNHERDVIMPALAIEKTVHFADEAIDNGLRSLAG